MNAPKPDFDKQQLLLLIQKLATALRPYRRDGGVHHEDLLREADAVLAKAGLDQPIFPG